MYFDSDQVVGVCGAAWGDEGKGKFTDVFAAEASVIVRAQGGCNAGHTVVVGDLKLKLHQVPSGIIYPGKLNVIGNGVVLDPRVLVEDELRRLVSQGVEVDGLRISGDAHLVLPWHRILDRAREWRLGRNRIGTTARGIGPAYADKAGRRGIRVNELYDHDYFVERLARLAHDKEQLLFQALELPRDTFEEWMTAPDQHDGAWLGDGRFNVDAIAASYSAWADDMRQYVVDTRELLHNALAAGERILLEGAQGLLLDIDHGTYPFVTSSNCSAAGFATGAGMPPQAIDRVYNVMSAYATRVGAGPFPTELGTEEEIAVESARNRMPIDEARALAEQATDDYSLGKVIRHVAGEFGTTTGRPRRTGWFDAVACKFAVQMNGPDVVITKLDVLDVMPVMRICTAYIYEGPDAWYNGRRLETGARLTIFPTDARILSQCRPVEYEDFQGWNVDTSSATSFDELPGLARKYLDGIAEHTGCRIRFVSVGPRRRQTLRIV